MSDKRIRGGRFSDNDGDWEEKRGRSKLFRLAQHEDDEIEEDLENLGLTAAQICSLR